MWFLSLALATPTDAALDAWLERVQLDPEILDISVRGVSDLDGDGVDETWISVGCTGVLMVDGERWIWVHGGSGEPLHGDPAPQPKIACSQMGDTRVDVLALRDGVPRVVAHRHSAHHGVFGASNVSERWSMGPERIRAVWAYDAAPLTLGERSVAVEPMEDGAVLRGLGPHVRLLSMNGEDLLAEVREVEGAVEFEFHDAGAAIGPGVGGLFVGRQSIAMLEVDGSKLAVDTSPLPPPPPHTIGSASDPPGPWSQIERSAQTGSPTPPIFERMRELYPDADRFEAHASDTTLEVRPDGATRIQGPPGGFVFDGRWVSRGPPAKLEAYRGGTRIAVHVSPGAFEAWIWQETDRLRVKSTFVRQGRFDLDADGVLERWAAIGCDAMLIDDEGQWFAIRGPGGKARIFRRPHAEFDESPIQAPAWECQLYMASEKATFGLVDGHPAYTDHDRSGPPPDDPTPPTVRFAVGTPAKPPVLPEP